MFNTGRFGRAVVFAGAFLFATPSLGQNTPVPSPPAEALEIAVEAYVYAFPLVLSELTRRNDLGTGVRMNVFNHVRAFPDATYTQIVRPNADTLYSILWWDVSKEPLAINVPDSGGRYYMLPMLDLWTDLFAVTGSRTTGNKAQLLVIAGPGWAGDIPAGATLIRAPTSFGWIIGRSQTNGAADYSNVHKFQDGIAAVPLSQIGKPYVPPASNVDPLWDVKTPPPELIEHLTAQVYFELFAELVRLNPPHANDYPILHRMERIGLAAGKPFSFDAAAPEVKEALQAAMKQGLSQIKAETAKVADPKNGWRVRLADIGTYGTNYRARAVIAFTGLGANVVEDAIYPAALMDADGKPFSSDQRYVMHFSKDEIPPVRGFWSLTMYDQRQLFTANPIDRFAIGDRDKLKFNDNGSLDLYIQRISPGVDKESNWLPAPQSGPFTMNLRLYWPQSQALDGRWVPPAVKRVQ